jgi:hypothetical protein
LLAKIEVEAVSLATRCNDAMDPAWRELAERSTTTKEGREQFHADRARLGKDIDPATAEITWWYGCDADPYGIRPDLPEEMQQVGRQRFARPPGGAVWICFDDLPPATIGALFDRLAKHRLISGSEGEARR